MKFLYLFLFFFFLVFHLLGQENYHSLQGEIYDKNTGEPLENVNIRILRSNIGTTTNELGKFKITIREFPVVIEISHVSYQSKQISLQVQPLHKITLKLEPKNEYITGITVTAQKIDTIYEDEKYSVLDYELIDEGILLLIFKYRLSAAELLLMDYDGKEINTLNVLPGKPLALYKDCLNETHVVTKDRVYQIYFSGDQIKLHFSINRDRFKNIMNSCRFKIGKKLYFETYENFNLVTNYFYVDSLTKQKHLLTRIMDSDKMAYLWNNPADLRFAQGMEEPNLGNMSGLPGDSDIMAAMRAYIDVFRFRQMAYYSEIYAPMYKMGDSICIFDHPNSKISIYNFNDSLLNSIPITYHQKEESRSATETLYSAFFKATKWQQDIFVDDIAHKAYTLFLNINGTKVVREIDLQTGNLTRFEKIPFPYVDKINVRNNVMYYIYKGWGETQKKKLYRQILN